MTRRPTLFAVIMLLSLPLWSWAANGQETQPGSQPPGAQVYSDIGSRTDGNPVLLCLPPRYSAFDARLGWWAFWNEGSPAKTGEYQSLKPSLFWDVDGLSSDGTRTLNFTATGNDQETTLGKLYVYTPGFEANVDYERFIHRLDHDPLDNIANTTPAVVASTVPAPKIIKQDLNLGQDYAVRVQELNTSFKKDISDNLRVRLDVWGMEKDGTRQVNAVAMCYNAPGTATIPPDHLGPGGAPLGPLGARRCHVLSQMQQIDWITTEIKPVIEYRLGDYTTIEYSRPMRNFTAADSTTSRFYDRFGVLSYNVPPGQDLDPHAYGVTPDNSTQMDQVKISSQITENTRFYSFLMAGNTVDSEIGLARWFNDMDFRLTNTSIENLSLTGYGTVFNEDEAQPDLARVAALNTAFNSNGTPFLPSIDHPIDYHKSTAGAKGVWRPGGRGYGLGGLAIAGGYEYCDLDRKFAVYDLDTGGIIDESHTITNSFQVGPDMRWSACFDTFLHYKYQNADQPLLGVQEPNGLTNTLLPQQDHIVEIGFNWVPSDWFIFNACVGIERGDTHGLFGDSTRPINFDEENYPMSFSAWYAATNRLSFSAGYAVYSNFVAQDISVADQSTFTTGSTSAAPVSTARWNYGGQAHVITFGARYCATERVRLSGEFEWVRGKDLINNSAITLATASTNPVVPGATITDLGSYSEVLNQTTRVRLGVDWSISPRVVNFYRYELYDFLDKAPGYQTGTAQGILGGLSAIF
jgi:hypothetical protein